MKKNNAVETANVQDIPNDSIETTNGDKPALTKSEKTKKTVNTIINVVLVLALVFAAICTFISYASTETNGVPGIFGIKLMTVQTDSMEPSILPGDLIIDVEVKDASELVPGDVITYWTFIQGKRVLNTHRIINVYDGGEFRFFETQGDNSTTADPITVHEKEIEGKCLYRIAGIGTAIDFMQTSLGFFLVVVLPVLIFFIYHLIQFFRVLFEYQNVKMLIKYEQERGTNEDIVATAVKDEQEQEEIRRAAYEAELRAKLKAELLADLEREKAAQEEAAQEEAENK